MPGKYYTKESKKRCHSEETKNQAIQLYLEGNSGRAVGRILGIGKNMCLYWVRKYAKNTEAKETLYTRVNVIEMDELYSFVERKNRFYAITLVSRDTREIVGFDITFDKSRERFQRVVDNSVKARQYYYVAYSAYAEVHYEGTHTSLKNKSQTYTVEGLNSDLRHYIPSLRRKSKCFFRSLETAKAVLKIFVNSFNLFAHAKKSFPHLKSAFCLSSFIYMLN